jgi:hypothetical protein
MHASLLNEDLIQPGKLEIGISHSTGGRTGHFDWGRARDNSRMGGNSEVIVGQRS